MKKIMLFLFLIFFVVVATAHSGQFGPPEPAAKDKHWVLDVGYFYSESKWSPSNSDSFNEGVVKQNQAYVQASYGFLKNFEGYARVGGVSMKIDGSFDFDNSQDFNSGFKPFVTIGMKRFFNINHYLGISPFVQGSLFSDYSDQKTGTVTVSGLQFPVSADISFKRPWEINAGLGLQTKIKEAILYTGPFLYWSGADAETTIKISTFTFQSSAAYSDKNNVGVFVGLKLPLALVRNLNFNLEAQFRSWVSTGLAMSYMF
ncbi:MAG: hypothetical protein AAB474_02845 [Patescibacteria group bacterium]